MLCRIIQNFVTMLVKKQTSYSDLLDALRLTLKGYQIE